MDVFSLCERESARACQTGEPKATEPVCISLKLPLAQIERVIDFELPGEDFQGSLLFSLLISDCFPLFSLSLFRSLRVCLCVGVSLSLYASFSEIRTDRARPAPLLLWSDLRTSQQRYLDLTSHLSKTT